MSPFQYDTFSTRMRSSVRAGSPPCSRGRIDPDGTKKLCARKVFVRAASASARTTISTSSSQRGMRRRLRRPEPAAAAGPAAAEVDTWEAYVSDR
jgi:hypothetical protein